MSASDEGNCAGVEEKEPVSPNVISEEKMKVHRGERYVHDIQIETLARSGKVQVIHCTSLLWYIISEIFLLLKLITRQFVNVSMIFETFKSIYVTGNYFIFDEY